MASTAEFSCHIDHPAEVVYDWHTRGGTLERLLPPWLPIRLVHFDGVAEGARAELRLGPGPLPWPWVAEIHDVETGRGFRDRQLRGPFAQWEHAHVFEPDADQPDTSSTLTDRIEYELPGGPAGQTLARWFVEPELGRQFRYRHRVTRRDLALHRRYNPRGRRLTVAVSGSHGLVGSALCAFLSGGGHHVKRIVRARAIGPDEILWDTRAGTIEAAKLEGVDAVVHLAGENVFGPWTRGKKQRILRSRREGTRLLAETLAGLDDPPEVLVSASAVGYYGDHDTALVTEETEPRDAGFLGEVSREWEEAAEPARAAGIRVVHPRLGIVLTPAGGALQAMLPAFRLGLGGRIGRSNQYLPWIAIDDVLGGIYHALFTPEVAGPVNLTAPEPVTADTLARTLARRVRRPAWFNVPGSAVRALAGELGDEMLLRSVRAMPRRLAATGYEAGYPTLDDALAHLLGH